MAKTAQIEMKYRTCSVNARTHQIIKCMHACIYVCMYVCLDCNLDSE